MAGLLLLAFLAIPPGANRWDHGYADVNGVKLHYVARGKGQLMLFLHGFPEFWYAWKDQLHEFGKHRRAVAVDMRGYNLSSKPESVEQYAMPMLVGDIAALAERLSSGHGKKKKMILVGHDWGGAVAWVLAMSHPESVEKLVIINAPHPGIFTRELRSNPDQQKASSYMLMFRGEQAEAILSADHYALLRRALFEGSAMSAVHSAAFNDEDRRAYLEAWSQPGALTGGLNYYRASRVGPDTGSTIAAVLPSQVVKVPTLVIWGEKDRALLTGNLIGLEELVPDLRVKRIPEGTHWVVHEYPELVNRYIAEFLGQK